MFTLQCRAGRLAELRFGSTFSASEMPQLRARLTEAWRSQTAKLVVCVDLRASERFGPEEEKQLIGLMQTDNPRIEKSAVLVHGSGRFGVQVLKMVQAANNRARRVFRDPIDLKRWLMPSLTPAESARLDEYLAESV
jgi:hypothetical protein